MNLDDLLKEMKEKMQSRDLSDKYLEENGKMTRTEMGIGEYGYGITTVPCEWVYDFLSDYKRVLKENEELKESNRKLYEIGQEMCKQDKYTSENYIPVQKVKDKIEEYKDMLKTCNKAKDIDRIKAINERILELEELLEGRK